MKSLERAARMAKRALDACAPVLTLVDVALDGVAERSGRIGDRVARVATLLCTDVGADRRKIAQLHRRLGETNGARALAESRVRELEALLKPPTWLESAKWTAHCSMALALAQAPETPEATSDLLRELAKIVPALELRILVLRNAIDRDRTGLARGLSEVQTIARGAMWIAEGRAAGGYAWDEEGYKEEARRALDAIAEAAQRALKRSGNLATCAIQGRPLPPALLPVEEAVQVLLLDDTRLSALLEKHWGEIRESSASGLPPRWEAMGLEEKAAVLRLARVALAAASRFSTTTAPPTST